MERHRVRPVPASIDARTAPVLTVDGPTASGKGTVYSVTTISPKPPAEPYSVVLVDLAEGPRMMSRIEGLPAAEVAIGMAVQARIDRQEDGEPILLFVPA